MRRLSLVTALLLTVMVGLATCSSDSSDSGAFSCRFHQDAGMEAASS